MSCKLVVATQAAAARLAAAVIREVRGPLAEKAENQEETEQMAEVAMPEAAAVRMVVVYPEAAAVAGQRTHGQQDSLMTECRP